MKKRLPGRKIGQNIYVHHLYELDVIPKDLLADTKLIVGTKIRGYIGIKYNSKTKEITFLFSPDFDRSDEPICGKSISVKKNGVISITEQKEDPQIWHHKWMWVGDDYKGFDIEESKKRSKLWESFIKKSETRKIKTLSYWNSIKDRWEK